MEHLYLVAYDIRDARRWRRVFRLLKGYGEWLQLSVFQCRLSRRRHAELLELLDGLLAPQSDALMVVDLGPADGVRPRVKVLAGKFEPIQREAVIV
ncbi:MAG: CRISPR-associated endoribonuclease Cas2 [Lysobacteraceae bacterium]|nr:MAG: CRISPR-associated endoribonuclease Cas2 [Xanthomonadaceae bacterium]